MNKKLLYILTAILALSAGAWISSLQLFSKSSDNSVIQIQGLVLDPARKIGVPKLSKDDGSVFTVDDLRDHWSIIFFGYTNCPDVCPTTMAVLAAAKAKEKNFPKVFFVSIDPNRDKVEMLSDYVKYFDPDFTGVTGDENMIKALTLQTSVVYMKVSAESGNEDDYLMDHSASLLLINPEGHLRAFLKPPHSPQTIIKSIKTVKESQ